MSDVTDVIAPTPRVVDLNRFAQARADIAATIATAATLTAQVIPIRSPLDAALAEIARLNAVVLALENANAMLVHEMAITAQNIDRVVDDLESNRSRSATWQRQVLLGELNISLAPWRVV